MKKLNPKIRLWLISLIIFGLGLSVVNGADASDVPNMPSDVYIDKSKNVLMVQKPNDIAKPFIIKGVSWSPATRAPANGPNPLNPTEPVQYGFFFDWSGRNPQGHEVLNYWLKNQFLEHYQIDINLMKQMNVNTMRIYTDFGDDPQVYNQILDEFYRNGIMVIMTVANSKEEIDNRRYLNIVRLCKDHPAILMWSLGNEWNLEYNKYYGYATVADAARVTELVAQEIKNIDTYHPVSSCLGDRFNDPVFSNTIAGVLSVCPSIDVWGINVYRGGSLGELFNQWKQITSKPLYLSEFGTDSFNTKSYTEVNGYQADNCMGAEDQNKQANFALTLWNEIRNHLSIINPNEHCLGGLVHEFNDELWKVGSYHVGLGGLVDYNGVDNINNTVDDDTSYDEYNTEGFYIPGGHPDNVANEEYFGVVDANRKPKLTYMVLQDYYRILDNLSSTIVESFENGFGEWLPDHDNHAPVIEVSISQEQALDGEKSVKMYIDGIWDDGTAWIERTIMTTPYSNVSVNINFWLWSQSRSEVNQWYVVAYAGINDPEREEDFKRIGVTDQVAGWKLYGYQKTVQTDSSGQFKVALGISCVYEVARSYYIDLVSIEFESHPNNPPVLSPIGNKTVKEGKLLTFTVSATDPDGDNLTYSATNLPQGASFDSSTHIFSWKPTYEQAGNYNVTFSVSDGRGGQDSETITITVINVNRSPQVGTIIPSSGSSRPNQAVVFTTTYSDPDGWQDIQSSFLLISHMVEGKKCFYGYYDQNTHKLYLRNDANTGWLGGYAPGSSNVIENSYAKLDCSRTAVFGSGTTLTIRWNITFKPAFRGTKKTYLYIKDDSGAFNGWTQKGTWRISGRAI